MPVRAVVDIDKAYQDLNKALDSLGGAYDKAKFGKLPKVITKNY
jgi:hypothetical protein